MQCPNKQTNLNDCNCSYSCTKKGVCCQCIAAHRKRNQLPACYFGPQAERTYDRSIDNFIKLWQSGQLSK